MVHRLGRCCIALLLACLVAGCASMDGHHDWWAVRATGSGDAARVSSTSHVNHGKPPAEVDVAPRDEAGEQQGNAGTEGPVDHSRRVDQPG